MLPKLFYAKSMAVVLSFPFAFIDHKLVAGNYKLMSPLCEVIATGIINDPLGRLTDRPVYE